MERDGIVVIDVGTSKVHANYINSADGGLLANATVPFSWRAPQPGWVEIDPEAIWQAAQSACQAILTQAPQVTPCALTFSWFGANLVVMDQAGSAVYPLIVSFDSRAEDEAAQLQRLIPPERARLVGRGGLDSASIPAKLLWLKRNRPDVFERIAHVGNIQPFFLSKLGVPFCTDRSMAATMQLREPGGGWMMDVISAAGLRREQVICPCPEADQVAVYTRTFGRVDFGRSIPVLYGGHDCVVSQLGCGVSPKDNGLLGDAAGTYDLMGFFRQGIGSEPEAALDAPMTGIYTYLGGGPVGAWLSQAVERLWGSCDGKRLTELFSKTVFDGSSGGLWALPDWETRRQDPRILTQYGEETVFASLVEELTFQLAESFQELSRRHGSPFRALRVGGGAARSDAWLQLKADVYGLPVERLCNPEISSVGAAVIAAVVLGRYPDYDTALAHLVQVEQTYLPGQWHNVYQERLQGFRTGQAASLRPEVSG